MSSSIQVLEQGLLYENSIPHLRSRHGYFPGVVRLPSRDLLALFVVAEAFEAANATICASRSRDDGRTWHFEGPIYRKPDSLLTSDSVKPLVLPGGNLLGLGYRFHRPGPDEALANPDTNGLRDGDNVVTHSSDEGHTWTAPQVIPTQRPETIEVSGPAIQLSSAEILAVGSLFPLWDGTRPSGNVGVLLRSADQGQTWDDSTLFFATGSNIAPSEPRICEMQPGHVVALVWACDEDLGKSLTNHVTVSHDGGRTWSSPMDTGIPAQASNLMYLGQDLLLTVHCHREFGEVGVFVRLVDFQKDRWEVLAEKNVWSETTRHPIRGYADMGTGLKFGQASLLPMGEDQFRVTHWAIGRDGQGRILTHRIQLHR